MSESRSDAGRETTPAPMHIAVIGAGSVGGTLGRRWAELGHTVAFGVREPSRGAAAVKGLTDDGAALPPRVTVTTPAAALVAPDGRRADAVLLATPWEAVPNVLADLGAALDGLPLLNATNPLGPGLRLETGALDQSGSEQVQAMAPKARVVAVFNTTGFGNMRDPRYDGAPTTMFYAGDDADANRIARILAEQLGFDPVDAGGLVRSRELDHLAVLWISLAHGLAGAPGLGRDIAFRLVRR